MLRHVIEEKKMTRRLLAMVDDEDLSPQDRSAVRLALDIINVLSMQLAKQRDGKQLAAIESAIDVVRDGLQP